MRLLGAFAILIAGAYLWKLFSEFRLLRLRAGKGFTEFSAGFDQDTVPADVIKEVYDYLQRWVFIKYPIYPSDELSDVFGMVGEDVDDTVVAISKRCRRVVRNTQTELKTVEDLCKLIANFSREG